MVNTKREDLIKSLDDKDFDSVVIETFNKIKKDYPFGVTILRIVEILGDVFNKKEWDAFEYRDIQSIEFDSYLINFAQNFIKGEKVNFTELKNSILNFGTFTESERRLFELGEIDKRLWAIIMAVTNNKL